MVIPFLTSQWGERIGQRHIDSCSSRRFGGCGFFDSGFQDEKEGSSVVELTSESEGEAAVFGYHASRSGGGAATF